MLDCTDAHFRAVCRSFSRRTHLWTEMIHQDAVIHSHASRPEMLGHDASEHPLTVQLGGSSPGRLARAAEICDAAYGYDEVNLNAGCPSAKVTSKSDAEKCFGAVLMRDPELVGECLRRMREAVDVPVTLKHRLGVRTRGAGGGGGGRRRHLHRHQHQSLSASGAFYTLVPIRPRSRGGRRSLRTFPGASLRPPLAFNTRPRRLSTPSDAFQLHPDIRLYRTALSIRRRRRRRRRRRGQLRVRLRLRSESTRAVRGDALHRARARRGARRALPRREPVDTTAAASRSPRARVRFPEARVRSIQKFFTHRPVSTFDRVPFQLTDELFLYGMALRFSLNGGVETVDDAVRHLSSGKLKGVMLGRAVYRDPTILHDVDARVYGDESGGVGVDPTLAKSRGDALTRYE
jgi:hypothetical protein